MRRRTQRAADALHNEPPTLAKAGEWRHLVAKIDNSPADHGQADHSPTGVVRQKALSGRGVGLLRIDAAVKAVESLEEADSLGADGEYGARSRQLLERAKKGG
ncbi:MAG: hypothetical protein IT457_23510 [Planctomycetes bacterium]|nr:hypothetical protein [Planctomycetota bacterium]